MTYFQFNSDVAKKHIQNHEEGFTQVAKNILHKAENAFRNGRCYLDQKFTIEDFDSSLDEEVTDFLEACIPYSHLWVDIQHGLDGRKAKIILS